jgi:phosphonate C-P lyase system protein PhnG
MSGTSEAVLDPLDRAEHLGILGYAPAESVKAFVADITPALGSVDVISVQTGLLSFAEAAVVRGSQDFMPGDVLVTEAHVLVNDTTDGYSAIFGADALHAVAVAVLDAALHAADGGDEHLALRERIERFIEDQAALLAQADEQAFPQANLQPA